MRTININKEDLKLCILPAESLTEAAELAAAAFDDSASYNYVCGHPPPNATDAEILAHNSFRHRFLCWFFERNFRMRLGTSANRAVFDTSGKLITFFMYVSPGIPDVGIFDMIRAGFLKAPFLFGLDVMKRLLTFKDVYERIEQEVMSKYDKPMYKLERLVVHPDAQNQGIGTHALKLALDEADEAGLPVILGTQEERNVQFYKRLGFDVAKECDIEGIKHWEMVRQPSPKIPIS